MGKKTTSSWHGVRKTGLPCAEETRPVSVTLQKLDGSDQVLNLKPKILKFLQENTGSTL